MIGDEAQMDRAAIERWESEGGRSLASEEALGPRPQAGSATDTPQDARTGQSPGRTGLARERAPRTPREQQ